MASGQLDSEPAQAVKLETDDQQAVQDLHGFTKRRRLTPVAMKTSRAFDNMFELSEATAGALPEKPPSAWAETKDRSATHNLSAWVRERAPALQQV